MPEVKKHLVFLVNPRSGVQRKKNVQEAVAQHLNQKVHSFEIQDTEYPHHGTQLAQEAAAAGAFGVVAVGGDGSVNDVAAGLAGSQTALGILPMGSGNGMARTLKIPLEVQGAIEVLNRQNVNPIDMGIANGRPFISNAGVGFDALISKTFASSKGRGFTNYALLGGKHFLQYKPTLYTLTIDGKQWQEKAFFINVANGRQLGYNFQIAPKASFTDGLLDIVILRAFPKWKGLGITMRGFLGQLLKSRYVRHVQGKSVHISSAETVLFQTDGDAWPCEGRVAMEVKPGALKVIMPS